MEIDLENDEGLQLFDEIMIEEEFIKTGLDVLTKEQHDILSVRCDNIIEIALGRDFSYMVYMTDKAEETKVSNPERQKVIFESTSKIEAEKIDLLKNYFATKDLKPLQNYWDSLFPD